MKSMSYIGKNSKGYVDGKMIFCFKKVDYISSKDEIPSN